jgi:hypothetical protein
MLHRVAEQLCGARTILGTWPEVSTTASNDATDQGLELAVTVALSFSTSGKSCGLVRPRLKSVST